MSATATAALKEQFADEIAKLREVGKVSVHESDDTFFVNLKPGTVRVLKAGPRRDKARIGCNWVCPTEFVSVSEMRANADRFSALTAFAEIVASALELSLSSAEPAVREDKQMPRRIADPMQTAYRAIMEFLNENKGGASIADLMFAVKDHPDYGSVFGESEVRAVFWVQIEAGKTKDTPAGRLVYA